MSCRDHRLSYDVEDVLDRLLDAGDFYEFQADLATEFLCGHARLTAGRLESSPIAVDL